MPGSSCKKSERGYTLVEMIVVLVVLSILATVAMRNLGQLDDIVKTEETKLEMDKLAFALVGNPEFITAGKRTDYGYFGDIGSLPRTWDDLTRNPGRYDTWKGPYLSSWFSELGTDSNFKYDAWGKIYSAPSGTNSVSFQSSGEGQSPITRLVCADLSKLLYNRVHLTITDLNFVPPGHSNFDSVILVLNYPDGKGGIAVRSINPSANGTAKFDSIPIGIHLLQTIFLQTGDTLKQKINVDPGSDYYGEIQHYGSIWSVSTVRAGN